MQSKVSMVVPCYNKEKYIGAMLQSVYNQIWDNIELILIYDVSMDKTREVISDWESRFIARGYEVVIIDREENVGGLCGAVRDGMLIMTGDYFCTVDCDDEILPEYVSTMAGWLDEHQEYEWAGCGHTRVSGNGNSKTGRPSIPLVYATAQVMLETYLMRRYIDIASVDIVCWVYMVRTRYAAKCKLVESFYVKSGVTQDPSIVMPLLNGGGRVKYFPESLYIYNEDISLSYPRSTVKDAKRQRDGFNEAECHIIANLNITETLKNRLTAISNLFYFKHYLYNSYEAVDFDKYRKSIEESLLLLVNAMFMPTPGITIKKLQNVGHIVLFQAIENCIWKDIYKPAVNETLRKVKDGRLIGYGALSKYIKHYFHLLNETPLFPGELWDSGAKPDSELFGISITKPDPDSLSGKDTVLVLPPSRSAIIIENILDDKGFSNYITSNELLDYLSYKYFPELYNGCKFVGDTVSGKAVGSNI